MIVFSILIWFCFKGDFEGAAVVLMIFTICISVCICIYFLGFVNIYFSFLTFIKANCFISFVQISMSMPLQKFQEHFSEARILYS